MTTIERSFPDADCEALRFQVGIVGRRTELLPIFKGRELVGHQPGPGMVETFHVIGYGSTEARARARAGGVSRNT